jgi:hypothetical protein
VKTQRRLKGSGEQADAGDNQAGRSRKLSGVPKIISVGKEAEGAGGAQADACDCERFTCHLLYRGCQTPESSRAANGLGLNELLDGVLHIAVRQQATSRRPPQALQCRPEPKEYVGVGGVSEDRSRQ